VIGTGLGIGFFKNDKLPQSPEFQALPEQTKAHLNEPTVPHYELALNGANVQNFIDPANTPAMSTIFAFLMNVQSRGSVTLQSSDPKVPLLFDPNFLSSPYDRRAAVELTRDVLKLTNHPAFQKDTVGVISTPKSDSEDDILEYWRQTTGSTWHMTGTAAMGKTAETAVVDKDFRVFGVEGLRVADMSVYPILPK
jgi:choline dehydrogenase-like flavoprotein